jgi:4a-hydroxytetrahydrobiopterin dehydratase
MARLSDDQVTARLAELPEWERRGDEIVRSYQAPSFLEGIAFVRRLAELAEAANHHPDIDIRWRTVRIALTTHDDGGLSAKDFALAAQIDDTFTVG